MYNGWSWGTNWAHGAVSRNAARGRKEAQRANAWTPRVVARWQLEAACTGCYTHYSARCQRRTGGRRGGELCVRHSSGGRGVFDVHSTSPDGARAVRSLALRSDSVSALSVRNTVPAG